MLEDSKSSPLLILSNDIRENIRQLKQLLLGRVLTIIDASISDNIQRKAIKDVIKDSFYRQESWTRDIESKLSQFQRKNLPDMKMEEWEAELWDNIKQPDVLIG